MNSSAALIYNRVSSEEQASKEHNLETQQAKCRVFCQRESHTVLKVFTDVQSGRTADKRVEFQKMLTYCRQHKREVKVVVVSDLSRLARSVADQASTIAEFSRLGIRLRSVDEPHIDQTAAGRLAANIHASFNQYFSDALSERTRERMQAACKAGRFPWVAPLGYLNVKNGASNLSVDHSRAPLVRKAFDLVGSGYGPDEARRVVTVLGLRTKNDRAVTKQTFSRLLRNELYSGWIVSGQLRAKGSHEPLISEQTFAAVQDRLNGKRGVPHRKENEDFPLRGFIRCAACDKPLTSGWSRGRSKR